MSTFQPPPTYAELLLIDQKSGKVAFNPIWLNWFISLSQNITASGPVTNVTASAPLVSSGGSTPNITLGVIGPTNFPALTGDITTPGGSFVTTLKNTGTAGTYTKVTFDAKGRETSGTSAVLASADFANQGTTTTVLHGNAAGNPSFGSVVLGTDTTGTLPNTSITGLGTMSTQNASAVTITGGTINGIGPLGVGVTTTSLGATFNPGAASGITGAGTTNVTIVGQDNTLGHLAFEIRNSTGTDIFTVDNTGVSTFGGNVLFDSAGTRDLGSSNTGAKRLYLDYTNTATVGSVIINKASGRVNLGAGGTTLTVTNSLVTAASHIFVTPDSAPGNVVAVLFYAVPGAGSFTVNAVPAVTNQTAINFVVVNAD